ncbi:MAG: transposase, partial [Longispora sp.]|nr:transposase [Longispora sp. (in: high G+C Gram-positive bacteria)]
CHPTTNQTVKPGHTTSSRNNAGAVDVDVEGVKDVLGIWLQDTESVKFWLHVLTQLKNRGVADDAHRLL